MVKKSKKKILIDNINMSDEISIKAGPKKLSAEGIKRSIDSFSNICSGFLFLFGIFLAYKFLGINNTISVFVFMGSVLMFFVSKKLVYNYGVRKARKKHEWLLNDLFVVKFRFKRLAGISLLTIISSSFVFVVFVLIVVPNIDIVSADNLIVGAHRGDSDGYTENTIPAFVSALENESYKFIEFDVQYTKDKKLVVYHDLSLLRLQKKIENINELTYEELEELSDYHIPLYEEVMDLVDGRKPLNIEVKSQGDFFDDMDIVDFLVADTKARGVFETTLFSSISSDVIKYFSRKYPEAKTGKIYYIAYSTFFNFENTVAGMYEEIEDIGADYLMLHAGNLRNYETLKRIKPANVDIIVWYLTDSRMYIIPSEGHDLLDKSGNLVGYVVGDADKWKVGNRKWKATWKGRNIFGAGFVW
ncbi:MAG: glycerophosphodiester phosphodiesterase [Nanoarchaeota archaeon]|nr:glycerophosphodiester phosphodiesterase [Nanoarchaeota archaeon]